ncbi:MAG TPA: acyltransferase family protein [Rhizobiaceae bacterium]|nr:acyltransferase family protein [Rhizobiaceae bacterium]
MTSPGMKPPLSTRRHDLDWLRVIAFALLIFYHVGMFYVTWDWHVKSTHSSPLIEPVMALLNPWRLALLFFISGVALHFAIAKTTIGAFLKNRTVRLFVPIAFGMLVVVMPQSYFELLYKGEIEPGLIAFYPDYFGLPPGPFSIITPTWNHLWYVVYILFYTLILAPLFPVLLWLANGPAARFFAWLERDRSGFLIVAIPVLPFVAYRLFLDPIFPTTHALFDDWANHAHSLTIVVLGFLAAKSPAFWSAIENGWRKALWIVIAGAVIIVTARLNYGAVRASDTVWTLVQVIRVVYAWAMIVTLLGMAQSYFNRPSRTLSYFSDAIFPYYILHQTLIVAIGFALLDAGLPAWLEATLVTSGTVLGCIVGYELVRRAGPARPLFGLPWKEKAKPAPAPRLLTTHPAAFIASAEP